MHLRNDCISDIEAPSSENAVSGFTNSNLTVVPRQSRSPDLNDFNFEEFLTRSEGSQPKFGQQGIDLDFMNTCIDAPAFQTPQRQVSANCPPFTQSQYHTAISGVSTQHFEAHNGHRNYDATLLQSKYGYLTAAIPQEDRLFDLNQGNYSYPAQIPISQQNKFIDRPRNDYRYPDPQSCIPEEIHFNGQPPQENIIPRGDFVTISRAEYERLLEAERKHSNVTAKPKTPGQPKKQAKPQEREHFSPLSSGSGQDIEEEIFEEKNSKKKNRQSNNRSLHPGKYYKSLPGQRNNWQEPINGYEFNYTANGELDLAMKLDVISLKSFIYYHPLAKYENGLTLWIQCVPADSGNRYPTQASSKCRFENCPAPNHTIKKGEFRICFDEWDWHPDASNKNPFHNAGYVHLYCLEKFIDFPQLCKTGLVKGDDRRLREGRNKMAITRDHPSMLQIVHDFIASSASHPVQGRDPNWFQNSLTIALTKEHMSLQPKARQSVRESRNGASIDKHMNNLDEMVRLRSIMFEPKSVKPAGRVAALAQSRKRKQREPETPSQSSSEDNSLFIELSDSIPLSKKHKTAQPSSWTQAGPTPPEAPFPKSPRRPDESSRDRLARRQSRLFSKKSNRQ